MRPLDLGSIYGGLTRTIRGNPGATIGLAVITTLVFLVPFTALGAWVGTLIDAGFTTGGGTDPFADPAADEAFGAGALVATYLPAIGTAFSTLLLAGFMTWVVGQAVLGRKVSAGQTWEGTRGRLLAVVGAALLIGLLGLVGFALLLGGPIALLVYTAQSGGSYAVPVLVTVLFSLVAIVGYLWFWTRVAFVPPVVVLERSGVVAALRRSFALTRRGFWRVFGIRLLTAFLIGTVAQVISFPLGLLGAGATLAAGPEHLVLVQAITVGISGLISGALTTPFTAGLDALLYVDQRIRLEGYDVELVAAAGGASHP